MCSVLVNVCSNVKRLYSPGEEKEKKEKDSGAREDTYTLPSLPSIALESTVEGDDVEQETIAALEWVLEASHDLLKWRRTVEGETL